MAVEDARQVVVDLQHLVLHRFEPLCLVVAGSHDLRPSHTVELVLAHQVSDELRYLGERHRARPVLDAQYLWRLRPAWRA